MPEEIVFDMAIIMGWIGGIIALCAVNWGVRKIIKTLNRS